MKECWDSDPSKRPTLERLENTISEWLNCINDYYSIVNQISKNDIEDIENLEEIIEFFFGNEFFRNKDIIPLSNLKEFVETSETLTQKRANVSNTQSHPQVYTEQSSNETSNQEEEAIYSSNSECLSCIITK